MSVGEGDYGRLGECGRGGLWRLGECGRGGLWEARWVWERGTMGGLVGVVKGVGYVHSSVDVANN